MNVSVITCSANEDPSGLNCPQGLAPGVTGATSLLLAAMWGPLCCAGDPAMDKSLVLGSPFHLMYWWQQL